jgi:hypothetical protein
MPSRTPPLAVVRAERSIDWHRAALYAVVADLESHRRFAGRRLRVTLLDDGPAHGRVQVRGPFGLRRTALTTVTITEDLRRFGGHAAVGRATAARVTWTLEDAPGGTSVRLEATVVRAGLLDRCLLAAGGRWWLRRCFADALDRLAAGHTQLQPEGA